MWNMWAVVIILSVAAGFELLAIVDLVKSLNSRIDELNAARCRLLRFKNLGNNGVWHVDKPDNRCEFHVTLANPVHPDIKVCVRKFGYTALDMEDREFAEREAKELIETIEKA